MISALADPTRPSTPHAKGEGRGRHSHTRVMILRANCSKSPRERDLEKFSCGPCALCCTQIEIDGPQAKLLATWLSLTGQERDAFFRIATFYSHG